MTPQTTILAVGGAPSSGTTLLADLADSVPGLACPPELYVFSSPRAYQFDDWFREAVLRAVPLPVQACYAAGAPFFNRKYLERTGLDDASLQRMVGASESLNDFMARFASHFAAFRGKPQRVLVEKTPINVNCAELFLRQFPEGKFIHVIRDGRAVVASLVHRGYTIYEAAMIWMAQTWAGSQLPKHANVIEVRYEHLVRSPFAMASRIAKAAGVSASEETIAAAFKNNQYRATLPRIDSWTVPGFTGAVQEPPPYWDRLSAKNIAWLEALELYELDEAGRARLVTSFAALLKAYGYRPSPMQLPTPSVEQLSQYYRVYLTKTSNYGRQARLRLLLSKSGDSALASHPRAETTPSAWAAADFSAITNQKATRASQQNRALSAIESEVIQQRGLLRDRVPAGGPN